MEKDLFTEELLSGMHSKSNPNFFQFLKMLFCQYDIMLKNIISETIGECENMFISSKYFLSILFSFIS